MTSLTDRQLTDRQHSMLAFERQWWKRDESRIAELFGCPPKQYRAELADLLALPAALAADPLLVRRLRRARSQAMPTYSSSTVSQPRV